MSDGDIIVAVRDQFQCALNMFRDAVMAFPADLMVPEAVFPWTGPVVLSRAIYILRNTQHHLSEMSLELTRRGYRSPDWR